jgi:hypothetical protein
VRRAVSEETCEAGALASLCRLGENVGAQDFARQSSDRSNSGRETNGRLALAILNAVDHPPLASDKLGQRLLRETLIGAAKCNGVCLLHDALSLHIANQPSSRLVKFVCTPHDDTGLRSE